MTANPDAVVYKRADVEGQPLGEEVVFFDDRVGKYFAASAVGADIWRIVEKPSRLDEIVAKLLVDYDVDEATCRSQTQAFLDKMVSINLISKSYSHD